jgi:predicted nucleotidyltransferase
MMEPMTTTPTPLVTREALLAFTQRLVERYAPEKVILYSCGEACGYGSLARGTARWDSDADVLVVMPFEGRHLAKIRWCARRLTMARCCMADLSSGAVLARYPGFETSAEEQAELVQFATRLRQALKILLGSEPQEA